MYKPYAMPRTANQGLETSDNYKIKSRLTLVSKVDILISVA